MGLTGEALDEFGRSRDILQSLVRTHPSNADYRRALAETHRRTAQAMTMQSPAAARDSFEEALKILETLVKESPQVPEYRSGLAGVADELADQIQRDNAGTPPASPPAERRDRRAPLSRILSGILEDSANTILQWASSLDGEEAFVPEDEVMDSSRNERVDVLRLRAKSLRDELQREGFSTPQTGGGFR